MTRVKRRDGQKVGTLSKIASLPHLNKITATNRAAARGQSVKEGVLNNDEGGQAQDVNCDFHESTSR